MLKLTKGHEVKDQGQICKFVKTLVSTLYHESMIWYRLYLHMWFITIIRCWIWPKVKVIKSKLKVKKAIVYKNVFKYISWTNDWKLMILTQGTDINKLLKLTPGQGHKIKDLGQIWRFVKNLFRLYVMNLWLDLEAILIHLIIIDGMLTVTQGQSHKVTSL